MKTRYANAILDEVRDEVGRQWDKWGDQSHHDDGIWCSILGEEFGESAKEVFEKHVAPSEAMKVAREELLESELIQVAAVAVSWIEAIRRRKQPQHSTRTLFGDDPRI